MKRHLKHLLMCAPMLVIGLVLLAGGAGVGALLPLVGCMAMMGAMMWMMMGGMGGSGDRR